MALSDLCVVMDEDALPRPIPEWALFLTRIGYQTAKLAPGGRAVVAAALPTRACAAALVASGVTHFSPGMTSEGIDPREHFLRLSRKPLGTKVMLTDRNKRLKGVLDGTERFRDEDFLRVLINTGNRATYFTSLALSKNIELLDCDGELRPRESGRAIVRRQ